MTDKERLIDLIREAFQYQKSSVIVARRTGKACYLVDGIADYLLANDVAIAKHGEWVKVPLKKYPDEYVLNCSICKRVAFGAYNFCPHCGAKMKD